MQATKTACNGCSEAAYETYPQFKSEIKSIFHINPNRIIFVVFLLYIFSLIRAEGKIAFSTGNPSNFLAQRFVFSFLISFPRIYTERERERVVALLMLLLLLVDLIFTLCSKPFFVIICLHFIVCRCTRSSNMNFL